MQKYGVVFLRCLLPLLCWLGLTTTPAYAGLHEKLARYTYSDTRQLVMLVEEAAGLIEKQGEAAFFEFGRAKSKWFNDQNYLFVYNQSGKCLFHPIESSLVGRNMSNFRDIENRPVIRMIMDIGKDPRPDSSGWVFYLWEEPWQMTPRWKSSYIRKAVAPDNTTYLIGSGLYDMKIEKVFVEQQVDKAADMMNSLGKAVFFNTLKNRSYELHLMNNYITVADVSGNLLVDPNFPSINIQRNIINILGMKGVNTEKEIMQKLKSKDRMWLSHSWPTGEADKQARRLTYIRKVRYGDEYFFIGMSFYPVAPIWMR